MNQFKINNKRSIFDLLFSYYYRFKINNSDNSIKFDAFVNLMRYPTNIKIGSHSYIKGGARICPCNEDAEVEIGKNTTIGYNTFIFASEKIIIGDNCMIAPNAYLVDSDHGIEKCSLMNCQDNITKKIIIEDDVWIGTGAVVLKGTYIPTGCVIAANSVVKGELEPYTIYGGVPIKKIGTRK